MRLAILGGTGDIGEGLAVRWGTDTDHEVIIGSRDPEKAERSAAEYTDLLQERGVKAHFTGLANEQAVDGADFVVLAVPPYYVSDLVQAVSDRLEPGTVLVSPAVGMKRDDEGFHYHSPPAGSVTTIAAENTPDGIPVVGAFHNLPAKRLSSLDTPLDLDTIVVSDDAEAKHAVMNLAESIEGLRVLDGGGLANAPEVEAITPLLINIARNNASMHDVGVSFH